MPNLYQWGVLLHIAIQGLMLMDAHHVAATIIVCYCIQRNKNWRGTQWLLNVSAGSGTSLLLTVYWAELVTWLCLTARRLRSGWWVGEHWYLGVDVSNTNEGYYLPFDKETNWIMRLFDLRHTVLKQQNGITNICLLKFDFWITTLSNSNVQLLTTTKSQNIYRVGKYDLFKGKNEINRNCLWKTPDGRSTRQSRF